MKFIKSIFSSLKPHYLIRQYLFGLPYFVFFVAFIMGSRNVYPLGKVLFTVYFTISLVLYPFAMFVYDSIISFLLGEMVIISNVFIVMIWNIIKIFWIFLFSIFIAPFGIIFLYIRSRYFSE